MNRKHVVWGAIALVLIVTPALIGLMLVGGDSGRRTGALVAEGGPTAYQLSIDGLTPAGQVIDVTGYTFGAENPVTFSASTGTQSGRLKYDELVITKKIDELSPKLLQKVGVGTASTAVLKLYRGGEKPLAYAIYTMKSAVVTSVHHSGQADNVPDEQVALVFTSLTLQSAGPDGKLSAPLGWDVAANKAATS
jgi:type VI protein secretion system component Hcp